MISSILDTDLYKISMCQAVAEKFPRAVAEYRFFNRDPERVITPEMFRRIEDEVIAVSKLRLTDDEYEWRVRKCRFLKPWFLDALRSAKLDRGRIFIAERYGREPDIDAMIPRAAVFAPLLLGTVLLVVARRNDGAAHFLRAFLGCASAFGAAVLATGPASDALGAFLSDGCVAGHDKDPLIQAGVLLALSFVLLFWPKRRHPGTIVV